MAGCKTFLAWLVTIVVVKEVKSTGHSRAAIDKPHSEKFEYKIVHGHHGPVLGHSYANGYGGFGVNGHGGVIGNHVRHGGGKDHGFAHDNSYHTIDHGGLSSYGHGDDRGEHFSDYRGYGNSGAHSLHGSKSAHERDYGYTDEDHLNGDEPDDEKFNHESDGEFNYKVLGYGDFIDLDEHGHYNGEFEGEKGLGDFHYGKYDWKGDGKDFGNSYGLGYKRYGNGNLYNYERYSKDPYKFNGYGGFGEGYWKGHKRYGDYNKGRYKGYGGYGGHNYGGYGKGFGGYGWNGLYDKGNVGGLWHGNSGYENDLGPYSYGYGKDGYNVPVYHGSGLGYGHGSYGKGVGYDYGNYGKGYDLDGSNYGGHEYSSPQKGWTYKYGEYGYASKSDSYNDHAGSHGNDSQ